MSSTRPNFPGKGTPLIGGCSYFRQKDTPHEGGLRYKFQGKGTPTKGGQVCN
jgi:hypothetical protein